MAAEVTITPVDTTVKTGSFESAYDASSGIFLSLDNIGKNLDETVDNLKDLLSSYQGISTQKLAIDNALQKMQQDFSASPLVLDDQKGQILGDVNGIISDWNRYKNCSSPGGRSLGGRESSCGSIEDILKKYEELQQKLDVKPTNIRPLIIPYTAGRYVDIPVYWIGQKGYKTSPTAIDRVNCSHGKIYQYILYHPDWKNNKEWWWIREVGIGDGCESCQFYYYRNGSWVLFYDEQASIDGHRQAMFEMVDDLELMFDVLIGFVMVGPDELVIDGGGSRSPYGKEYKSCTEEHKGFKSDLNFC